MTQKEITEAFLYDLLEEICNLANINLSEWHLDKRLFEVLTSSPDNINTDIVRACYAYDHCFNLATALDVDIDPKYFWFLGLSQWMK